ncbi:MAG: Sbal_3080 family lipoprotein [Planctomycetota bacterium]
MVALVGCTSVTVRPVDQALGLEHVYIQENPRVAVSDFLQVVVDGFERHGISCEVFSGRTPPACDFLLTYTALRSWDLTPYLSQAELRIEYNGREVAYARYHLRGKGGFALTKYAGTKSKIDPVLDELLAGYR